MFIASGYTIPWQEGLVGSGLASHQLTGILVYLFTWTLMSVSILREKSNQGLVGTAESQEPEIFEARRPAIQETLWNQKSLDARLTLCQDDGTTTKGTEMRPYACLAGTRSALGLHRSHALCHNGCEFLRTAALLCPDVSLWSVNHTFRLLTLFPPLSSKWSLSLGR